MDDIKYIKQLPELEEHQEWGCSSGCGQVTPKLFRYVYGESWDENGVKVREMSENYYTCQCHHALQVWDNDANDYVVLPDQAYQARENVLNLTLENIENIRTDLADAVARYTGVPELVQLFKDCNVAYELTLKDGSIVNITNDYLNEIEAELKANMILGGAYEF